MSEHTKGELKGQEVISGGTPKVPNNDALAAEKSKSVGPAKPAEKPFSDHCNVPEGQKVF